MSPSEKTHSGTVRQRRKSTAADETVGFTDLWRPKEASAVPHGPEAVLLKEGKITAEQYAVATVKQKEKPKLTVLEVLRQDEVVDETTALQAMAAYFNLRFHSVTPEDVDRRVFGLLDAEFIQRRGVIPIREIDGEILVGISDPADIFLVDEVKRRIRHPVQLVVTPPSDIQQAVEEIGGSGMAGFEDIIQGIGEDEVEVVESNKDEVTDLEKLSLIHI